VNSNGRPLAHWILLGSPATAAGSAAAAGRDSEAAAEQGQSPADAAADADAAAALGWCDTFSCLVKSVTLPVTLQQPLQQSRW
jgi:hypothetical protein